LMALHEHPTLYQPTSTSIRLVLTFPVLYHCNLYVQLLCTWYRIFIFLLFVYVICKLFSLSRRMI